MWEQISKNNFPTGIYLFKVNNENARTASEICSKLPIKTTEWRHWRRFGIFFLTLDNFTHCFSVCIVDFEQLNTSHVSARFLFCQILPYYLVCTFQERMQQTAMSPDLWLHYLLMGQNHGRNSCYPSKKARTISISRMFFNLKNKTNS